MNKNKITIEVNEMAGIFHNYDIRGIYPKELDEEKMFKLGQCISNYFNQKQIIVGKDTRISSPKLHNELIKGITDQGKDVIDIDLCSTPMLYFASSFFSLPAVMVTASHNPKEYNGLKITQKNSKPVGKDSGLDEIENMYRNNKFNKKTKGDVKKEDIMNKYREKIRSFIEKTPSLKMVIDASNGMTGLTIPKILEDFNIKKLNFELDGTFPAHSPNPMKKEAMEQLKNTVKKKSAAFGAIFDSDGDRIIFVDENGKEIAGDRILALIAKEVLMKKPGKVLYDLRCSKMIPEKIRQWGGTPIESRVGHSYIKERMTKGDIVFAGELSAHYYYNGFFNSENGLITLIKITNLLEKTKKKLSELVEPLNEYYQSGETNFSVEDKEKAIKEVEKKYKKTAQNIKYLDGVTLEFDDWWFNLRKSGTEPVIRLNLEAETKSKMESKTNKIKQILSKL